MSVLSLFTGESDALAAAVKGGWRMSGEVTTIVGGAAPLARLAMQVPTAAAVVQRFQRARLLATHGESKLIAAEFLAAREALINAAKKADGATARAVEQEVKAAEAFFILKRVADSIKSDARLVSRTLDEADVAVFRTFTERLMMSDEPAQEGLKYCWRQIVRGIGPDNAADWALVLSEARKAAANLPGDFFEHGPGWRRLLDQQVGGRISNVQGALFEPYGRALLKRIGEIDEMLNVSRRAAAVNGPGWSALHVNGELRVAFVDTTQAKVLESADGMKSLAGLKFEQYADDAVLALRQPVGGGLSEAEASALIDFKAERGPSGLGEKLDSLLRRWVGGDSQGAVIIRFTGTDGREVSALLRPPKSGQNLTLYGVGTEGTMVPLSSGAKSAGIRQRQVVADVTRDDLRELCQDLVMIAAGLRR